MTEDIDKVLNKLKGNTNVKKLETHFLQDGAPIIDVRVRKELFRLEFYERSFAINRMTKAKVYSRRRFQHL
jgi:hypothetical protein